MYKYIFIKFKYIIKSLLTESEFIFRVVKNNTNLIKFSFQKLILGIIQVYIKLKC